MSTIVVSFLFFLYFFQSFLRLFLSEISSRIVTVEAKSEASRFLGEKQGFSAFGELCLM